MRALLIRGLKGATFNNILHAGDRLIRNRKKAPRVLVAIVYTDYKAYVWYLPGRVYNYLTYDNKKLLMVTTENCPALEKQNTGEERAAVGRNYAVHYARKHDYDYILFLDADVQPPADVIEQLIARHCPMVGAATAARGNEYEVIGHNYLDRETFLRQSFSRDDIDDVEVVDNIGGCCLLVERRVFNYVDYSNYTGPNTIEGYFLADDEWFQLQAWKQLRVLPTADFNCRPWHYDNNGWAYRIWGEKVYWRGSNTALLPFNN